MTAHCTASDTVHDVKRRGGAWYLATSAPARPAVRAAFPSPCSMALFPDLLCITAAIYRSAPLYEILPWYPITQVAVRPEHPNTRTGITDWAGGVERVVARVGVAPRRPLLGGVRLQ
jgi:hypothetical protein